MKRSTAKILLAAVLIAAGGCLMSAVCTAISWWLTGSGYLVQPGGAF